MSVQLPNRQRLPNDRDSEIFQFERDGIRYRATISRFADGRLAELFLDTPKPNAAIQIHAEDAAVLVSLLLQFGVSPAAIRHSISGPAATALRIAESSP